MLWIFVVMAGAAALCGIYLLMIRPCVSRSAEFAPFENTMIAHRGLFDNNSDAPENTLPAFEAAICNGFGIELDVQMSLDGKLVVFHDWDLKRMAGIHWKISDHTYEELCRYPVGNSQERIPLFSDVLKLVCGAVPMVIEIKVGYDYRKTTEAVAKMLSDYQGVYCVECFNPLALFWYRKHVPQVIRGQLSMDYEKDPIKMPWLVKIILTNLMMNFCAKPDFISYNHKDQRKKGFRLCRKLFRVKTAAWTIKNEQELENAKGLFDVFIFDGFLPRGSKKVEE